MKIIFINTLYYPNIIGGAEKSVQFLAESLVEAGHEPIVITLGRGKDVDVETINKVKIYRIGLKNIYWPFNEKNNFKIIKPLWHLIDLYNVWMARKVDSIIFEEKPDIVHTNNLAGFSTLVWKYIKARNIFLVHTIRDYYLLCPQGMFKNGKNCKIQCFACKHFNKPRLHMTSNVDAVVGISNFVLQKHLTVGMFNNAIKKVIYNSLQDNSINANNFQKNNVRFGYIGTLGPHKGVELILNMFNKKSFKNIELVVAGRGNNDYEQYIKRHYQQENIKYIGFVEPQNFFSQIDVLLVPSIWHEPLGRIVFEAYSYGKPVVASRRGGIPELMEEGQTGYLFEPDNLESLANIIDTFIEYPGLVEKMRSKCVSKAKLFLPNVIISQYIDVYKNLVF